MSPSAQALCAQVRSAIVRTGWSETARRSGIRRETLHRSFSGRPDAQTPSLTTIAAVADALDLALSVTEARHG